MLDVIQSLNYKEELLKGNFGIERETLRVDRDGKLALTKHPEVFECKISHPYITTDFSESQIELITPTVKTLEEVYSFVNSLYDITVLELNDEYLWPQSMPCSIPSDDLIPIADYGNSNGGGAASDYRKKLLKKYGGKKQLISGIHYNFSFDEELIKDLYEKLGNDKSYKEFKDSIYLKVVRNYLRYRWLLIYLLGGTTTMHETFGEKCVIELDKISKDSFSNVGAVSYRNSECGYKNPIDLYPNYNSVREYVGSVYKFIDDKVIDSHKELYTQIRLKAKDNDRFLESLVEDGINYLEIRSIDINPFTKAGISLEDLNFINLFTIYSLIKDESTYEKWQEEAQNNQNIISMYGQMDVVLYRDGDTITKNDWALNILNEMKEMSNKLSLGKESLIDSMIEKVINPKLTYAYRISQMVKEEGFIEGHLRLAKEYKEDAYKNRFKLEGFEDLELSTQILMKEAMKRGIKVDVIDRADNFISLKKDNHIEYVKQATKTSKDNYITVLMMENKVVTKKILDTNEIRVPQGDEFFSLDEAINKAHKYDNKAIVVKPKSTNFGLGISIFKEGANTEDIKEAFKLAFEHDNTVLVEEFITGKEYRFLVVGDKVPGILHRVPANVIGDGKSSIRQLVEEKNKSSLRGKGYKTPLEKINLDNSAKLFLKQIDRDFDYVPEENEIVYLRENSNISTGGDSIDYTDLIPQRFKDIAVESSKAVGANICGVDMMIEDYKDENSNYAIIELNFNPAIHIHSYPYKGKEREIAKEILNILGFLK
ncbi:bifunctional glutamate--cysteine ligase GshA/glutathione synthetase GshB [Clostridium sp. AL.422]|uniref:bifunctional glutamate--cysteine ligase GshA/glutathione synthetase GshB n=1 Tax=Clostridium TaxID=1485 RepID=UPI00293DE62A|nr:MULTISPECIES: bifunctional glutamate--cysteine ligase GshA/glutathione synthetase GshB [unclassified Clostridium]MDV4152095.1 bifunctional glutamate--cysteine ligase GshA/glutathione synthetase GshB [Clostridium sp. AL.422]